jgi:hypothetical protein
MFHQTKVLQNHDIFHQRSRSDLINVVDNPQIVQIDSRVQELNNSFSITNINPNKKRESGNFDLLTL